MPHAFKSHKIIRYYWNGTAWKIWSRPRGAQFRGVYVGEISTYLREDGLILPRVELLWWDKQVLEMLSHIQACINYLERKDGELIWRAIDHALSVIGQPQKPRLEDYGEFSAIDTNDDLLRSQSILPRTRKRLDIGG